MPMSIGQRFGVCEDITMISMVGERGIVGDRIAVEQGNPAARRPRRSVRVSRRMLAALSAIVASLSVIALILAPTGHTTAHPGNTGGSCTCHPSTTTTFETITGLPAGTYNPGQAYSVTVSIADTNGATGYNSFDFMVTAGTITSSDPNVKIYTAQEAVASVFTVSSWTLTWTAPATGSVSVNGWAVFGGGQMSNSPYNHLTYTLNPVSIPEFTTLLVPVVGMLGAIFVSTRIAKKKS